MSGTPKSPDFGLPVTWIIDRKVKILVFLYAIGSALFGICCGSLPFALWITRLVQRSDVRGGRFRACPAAPTPSARLGLLPGALGLRPGLAKGFAPPVWPCTLHLRSGSAALTAALAVVGHCWPVFCEFPRRHGPGSRQRRHAGGFSRSPFLSPTPCSAC